MLNLISKYRFFYIGLAFLFLSIKGFNDAYGDVLLPSIVITLKTLATPSALLCILMYTLSGIIRKKISPPGLMAKAYVLVLMWYYFAGSFYAKDSTDHIYALVIMTFLTVGLCLDAKRVRRETPAALLMFSSIYVSMSLIIFIFGYGYAENSSRFSGIAYHQNANGISLAISLITLLFYSTKTIGTQKAIIILGIASTLLLILVSGSRAAILVSLTSFLLLPRSKILISIAIITSTAIITGTYFITSDSAISLSINRMLNAPMDNRNEVWSILWQSFLRQPFWGEGDFSGVSGNIYLSAFAGTGMLGGLVFLFLSFKAFLKSTKILTKSESNDQLNEKKLAAALIIMLLVGGLFEGYIFDRFGLLPYLFILSLMIIQNKKEKIK